MKVLITGANGFIGSALCPYLTGQGHTAIPAVRRRCGMLGERIIENDTAASAALDGCDSVIHLAGRAHVMKEQESDPLTAFREANVDATLNLANRAVEAGVRRFVLMSSIKVNGERSAPDKPFTPNDIPAPEDPYAISKWEAERGLFAIAQKTGIEVVIVRPPLVYGPGVKGNFAALIHYLNCGLPLPLGAIDNRRSMIALDNLLDFTALCADRELSPRAGGQVFLVSDGEAVSTAALLRKLAHAYGRTARLLPVPPGLMRLAARLVGKTAMADRLLESLVLDDTKAREVLGWRPPVSMDEQLKRMAHATSA